MALSVSLRLLWCWPETYLLTTRRALQCSIARHQRVGSSLVQLVAFCPSQPHGMGGYFAGVLLRARVKLSTSVRPHCVHCQFRRGLCSVWFWFALCVLTLLINKSFDISLLPVYHRRAIQGEKVATEFTYSQNKKEQVIMESLKFPWRSMYVNTF